MRGQEDAERSDLQCAVGQLVSGPQGERTWGWMRREKNKRRERQGCTGSDPGTGASFLRSPGNHWRG